MSRPTIEEIERYRASSTPTLSTMPSSVTSEIFKSTHSKSKPKSKGVGHLFSNESRNFQSSRLKQLSTQTGGKNIIRLGAGRPNAELYPWSSAAFTLTPAAQVVESQKRVHSREDAYGLAAALNYGTSVGSPLLVRFLTEHTEIVHDPPYRDWGVCVTCGSTSSMEVALRMFCNPGDSVLSEQYTYPGFAEVANLVGVRIRGVEMDSNGISSKAVDEVLSGWDTSKSTKPKLLYTIPSGQNPTGYTQPLARRKEIYALAEKHDLIILEDDPYMFLGPFCDAKKPPSIPPNSHTPSGPQEYLSTFIPTYLSMDHSGRVIRLDSTSKILSPGLRIGWVTASSQIISKFLPYNGTSSVAASGPSQIMLYRLLEQRWGHRGFLSWLSNLSDTYQQRRTRILRACDKYLPRMVCSWIPPAHGMFLWVRLETALHPRLEEADQMTQEELSAQLLEIEFGVCANAMKRGVQIMGGSLFAVDSEAIEGVHVRLTYAAATQSDIEHGIRILGDAICEEFDL